MSENYLFNLNNRQYDAATKINGYNLIFAGAGSGKTATIVARTAYILEQGINPESILLLTFTNKAADEMKARTQKLIGEKAEKITACTFHSFCAMFLRKNGHLIHINPNYTILDSQDTTDVLDIAKQEFLQEKQKENIEYDFQDFPYTRDIIQIYEMSVNKCIDYETCIRLCHYNAYKEEILAILQKFRQYKKERNFLDYNDLLYLTEKILDSDIYLRKKINEKYQYIMCDEYQDTNIVQDKILKHISEFSTNLAVVGDDNQSIYAFRYAEIDNILNFDKRYPNCNKIVLETNYRSSQEILDTANTMMHYAKEGQEKRLKGLFSDEKPELVIVGDCYEEADYILDTIKEKHYKMNDTAIICRSAMQSYILEQNLTTKGIPYVKYGGIKFLEKANIRDILAFLRISVNLKDELAWYRILQLYPGIGKTYSRRVAAEIVKGNIDEVMNGYKKKKWGIYLDEIKNTIAFITGMELQRQLKFLIETYYPKIRKRMIEFGRMDETKKAMLAIVLSEQIEDAKVLYGMTQKYKSTEAFLNDLILEPNSLMHTDDEKITITTIHSAKGLEYENVFLLDCIKGVMPRCAADDKENNEELRCMYVAITRAKRHLHLMVPQYYNIKGIRGKLTHFLDKSDILDTLEVKGNIDTVQNQDWRTTIW